jgi:predicted homoserine dehydrogenase-like protein
MIIVDRHLQQREQAGKPIQVALLGSGFMGRGLTNHIENYVPGMRIAGVFSRHLHNAARAYQQANVTDVIAANTLGAVEDAIRGRKPVVTTDASLLCSAQGIDVVIDVTGSVPFGAEMVSLAIRNGKHVLINAELDATLGPILKVHADQRGVVLSAIDGDQPGTELNLFRSVQGMGMTPLMCGNIKALLDHYRTPETQRGFAEKWKQNPVLCTSFADASKISFEQAVVANATGMGVAKRGMLGRRHDAHVDSLTTAFDIDELKSWGGVVDYVIGAQPSPGVFILATTEDKHQRHYLNMYKMGEGPLYCFYAPYHLAHLETPFSIARAMVFHDATSTPIGAPVVDVVALAKRDLRPGDKLDGPGGYTVYGACENAGVAADENLLPIALSEDCEVVREIGRDQALTYADVRLPANRHCDALRNEQQEHFPEVASRTLSVAR